MKTDWSNIAAVLAFLTFLIFFVGKEYFGREVADSRLLISLAMAIYFKADSVRDNVRAR